MNRNFESDPEYPMILDRNDPLGHFRRRFYMRTGEIYMCGNALGLASTDAEEALLKVMEKWKEGGVKLWSSDNSRYCFYSSYLAELMAPLIGAMATEIVVAGSTTSNIHQAISTLYKPTKSKYKILVDAINFPTDRYAVDSQVRLKGYEIDDAVKVVYCNEKFMNEYLIIDAMTPDVALVLLPTVYYKTAQVLDMKRISEAANARDIIIGWDLCHAIGAMELDLQSLNVDFAVWCTYKYLNGGPGSSSGLYINRKHFNLPPGLAGWFGSKKESLFMLSQVFDHQKNANGWQIGTPSLFSMATLEGSLKMFTEAGLANIRKKSLHITAYLMYLIDSRLVHYGFSVGNLREDRKRGGHVCLEHKEAYRITLALKTRGVVSDFRPPNVIRLTPVAFYTSYLDVYKVVEILLDAVQKETYKRFSNIKNLIV